MGCKLVALPKDVFSVVKVLYSFTSELRLTSMSHPTQIAGMRLHRALSSGVGQCSPLLPPSPTTHHVQRALNCLGATRYPRYYQACACVPSLREPISGGGVRRLCRHLLVRIILVEILEACHYCILFANIPLLSGFSGTYRQKNGVAIEVCNLPLD
jgi:hypothetical protein